MTATNAAKSVGATMFIKFTRMLEPADVSEIICGGERRATSAICTPFQLAAEHPATNAKAITDQSGQPALVNPSSAVVTAEKTAAIVKAILAERK